MIHTTIVIPVMFCILHQQFWQQAQKHKKQMQLFEGQELCSLKAATWHQEIGFTAASSK